MSTGWASLPDPLTQLGVGGSGEQHGPVPDDGSMCGLVIGVPVRWVERVAGLGQVFRRFATSARVGDYSTFAGAREFRVASTVMPMAAARLGPRPTPSRRAVLVSRAADGRGYILPSRIAMRSSRLFTPTRRDAR
jgi:hypothetical protein